MLPILVSGQSAGIRARPVVTAIKLSKLSYSPFLVLLVIVIVAVGLNKVRICVLRGLLPLFSAVNDGTDIERICTASKGRAGGKILRKHSQTI